MKNTDYYKLMDFKYPEIGICIGLAEDRYIKIAIPALTPFLNTDEAYDEKDPPISLSNIKNDATKLSISECTTSNYIEVVIPSHLDSLNINVGDKFVIIFIGGDINKPYIVGRYDEQ